MPLKNVDMGWVGSGASLVNNKFNFVINVVLMMLTGGDEFTQCVVIPAPLGTLFRSLLQDDCFLEYSAFYDLTCGLATNFLLQASRQLAMAGLRWS